MINQSSLPPVLPPATGEHMLKRMERLENQGPSPSASTAATFSSLLKEKVEGKAEHQQQDSDRGASLEEAGRQMEVLLTTFMLKTMEKSSTEGGLLGSKSQGMGYFKDLFLENIAKEVVHNKGLGFGEALRNNHNSKNLDL